jgi:transposase-like protein
MSSAKSDNPFRYFHSSPEVIRLVVMMYIRFPLSLRNVEDLLFERGIDLCHGEMVYLWRAVDHEGEILESFVAKKRDKSAALAFMKKALKRHGQPKPSSRMGSDRIPRRCANWAIWSVAKWAGTSTVGLRTHISRSADESGRCSDFAR